MLCPGVSIHACKKSSHHFVALEADSIIFDIILSPLCKKTLLSHVEVYLTLHPSWTMTNMFRRLQRILALVSKHVFAI